MGHSWVSQQAVISDVFTSVTSVSLDAAAAKPGEHVIDIGCGTSDTLLAFAEVVGPSGAVLGVDVSVPMLDFAKHRAAEATLSNAAFALADATSYAFEPRWADLVYSRFGVMFFDDPIRAFTNIRSGMKAGGRLVFVCFRTTPESPWFHVPIDAARPHVPPQPPVDPLAPGMFSLAHEERLRGVLRLGFARWRSRRPTCRFTARTPRKAWHSSRRLARCLRSSKMPWPSNGYVPQKRFATRSPQISEQTGAACMWVCGLCRR
jgi:SAM-dependent methyltransferase